MDRWKPLDLIRGFAVIFMLVNHSIAEWGTQYDFNGQFSSNLFFISSFAPVLFFFATGVGFGLAHQVGHFSKLNDIAIKASILIIIDFFMRNGNSFQFGWDFLAFIAFSMLLLSLLRGRKYGITLAVFIILILVFLRYGIGVLLNYFIFDYSNIEWLNILLGTSSIPNVSYWFTPWLVYPLSGFIFGALIRRFQKQYFKYSPELVVTLFLGAIIVFFVSFLLYKNGAIYFRWGTVSINFFIASFSCLLFCISLAILLLKSPLMHKPISFVSLQGVNSLAIVPIHYFLINVINIYIIGKVSQIGFIIILISWFFLCFFTAKNTELIAKKLKETIGYKIFYMIFSIFIVFLIISFFDGNNKWLFVLNFIIQYLLCLLLVYSYSSRIDKSKKFKLLES